MRLEGKLLPWRAGRGEQLCSAQGRGVCVLGGRALIGLRVNARLGPSRMPLMRWSCARHVQAEVTPRDLAQ